MTTISAQAVKALRDRTGLPIMDCKQALVEADGDEHAAVEILRKKGMATAEKKAGRETNEGCIACYTGKDTAGIVELRCESAPVANSDDFRQLAADLARQAAETSDAASPEELLAIPLAENPDQTGQDRVLEVQNRIRENMALARFLRLEGNCRSYVHFNGRIGVLIKVEGESTGDLLSDVCKHIAAMAPLAVSTDQLDPTVVEKEREILTEQAQGSGKPAEIVEKMVEGRLRNFYAEKVLDEQPFVRKQDPSSKKTVGQVLKENNLKVLQFVRWEVGGE